MNYNLLKLESIAVEVASKMVLKESSGKEKRLKLLKFSKRQQPTVKYKDRKKEIDAAQKSVVPWDDKAGDRYRDARIEKRNQEKEYKKNFHGYTEGGNKRKHANQGNLRDKYEKEREEDSEVERKMRKSIANVTPNEFSKASRSSVATKGDPDKEAAWKRKEEELDRTSSVIRSFGSRHQRKKKRSRLANKIMKMRFNKNESSELTNDQSIFITEYILENSKGIQLNEDQLNELIGRAVSALGRTSLGRGLAATGRHVGKIAGAGGRGFMKGFKKKGTFGQKLKRGIGSGLAGAGKQTLSSIGTGIKHGAIGASKMVVSADKKFGDWAATKAGQFKAGAKAGSSIGSKLARGTEKMINPQKSIYSGMDKLKKTAQNIPPAKQQRPMNPKAASKLAGSIIAKRRLSGASSAPGSNPAPVKRPDSMAAFKGVQKSPNPYEPQKAPMAPKIKKPPVKSGDVDPIQASKNRDKEANLSRLKKRMK